MTTSFDDTTRPAGTTCDSGGEATRALGEAYERHHRRIYLLCLRSLRNAADAEDATQETFARVAPHAERLGGDIGPYLAVVARRVCAAIRGRGSLDGLPEDTVAELPSPDETATSAVLVQRALDRLSRRDRLLLGQSFAGYSCTEIALRMTMSAAAVTRALSRARERARHAVSESALGALVAGAVEGTRHRLAELVARLGVTAGARGEAARAWATAMAMALIAGCLGSSISGLLHGSHGGSGGGSAAVPSASLRGGTASLPVGRLDRPGGTTQALSLPGSAPTAGASARHGVDEIPGPAPTWSPTQLIPGPDVNQDEFDSMAVSPDYDHDHTVLAVGRAVYSPCACPVLFRSRDGGATWERLPAVGLTGYRILLPPAFGADRTIFADGNGTLERSDDGGLTFRPVAPSTGTASIDPTSPPGRARVLLGTGPGGIYDAATGSLLPGPPTPPGVGVGPGAGFQMSFAEDGGHFVYLGHQAAAPAEMLSETEPWVLARCDMAGSCTEGHLPADSTGYRLLASWQHAADATLAVVAGDTVSLSVDSGRSWRALSVPIDGGIAWVSLDRTAAHPHRVSIGTSLWDASGEAHSKAAVSDDDGRTFATLPTAVRGTVWLSTLHILPDGHILAALLSPDSSFQLGIRCSTDGGATWQHDCSS